MGDEETNFQPSKKRAAGVQLSRDNPGLDDDEEALELETGSFKRASNEVLASRRIVKVRRPTPTPPPSSASNPFAAIRLVPPTNATNQETEQNGKNDGKFENEVDESKAESSSVDKTDVNSENAKQVDESKPEPNSEKDKIVVTEADISVESEKNEEEKENLDGITEKNTETAPFSSFQQLSSTQNAFSRHSGSGFSGTTFSFGSSVPKEGSIFGFGVSNNGNSTLFGTSGLNLNSVTQTQSSKFPPMPEVPVETGEENENAVFTADSALFEFIDGSWKERGKGEIKLNVSITGTGKSRLIMRARGNYRLILNAILFPDLKLTDMDKRGVTFACVNSAAGEGQDGLSTIALKFRNGSIAEEFRAAVNEHKGKEVGALKTPENSPRASDE